MRQRLIIRALCVMLLAALISGSEARAQDSFFGISYTTSAPVSDTKAFINKFSWRNVGFDLRWGVHPKATVGLYTGWNVFSQKTDGLFNFEGVDVSGAHFRYVNAFPFMINAHYYFGKQLRTQPYIGANVGTYWIKNRLDMIGTSTIIERNVLHFGLAPEVGLLFPLGGGARGLLTVRYNYAAKRRDFTHTYFTFGVGLAGVM